MVVGRDVSRLGKAAATAAAQGLSIVVPVYNEAAGLELLHQRLNDLAITVRQRYGLGCEVVYVDDGSTAATVGAARPLKAGAPDVPVVSLSRKFRKAAALTARVEPPPR